MKEFIDNLRKITGENTEETADTENLHLTKREFMERMLKENDGWALLDCLESGEHRVAERLGLINGNYKDGEIYFDIPRWNNLVAHLRIVNSV